MGGGDAPPATEPDAARAGRRTVLLVEDQDADRELYGGLLWYNGYEVLHASDGERAVQLALEAKPDLILLDVRLPGPLTGIDVARRLRDAGLEAPMIVLSAVPKEELAAAAADAGVIDYLEKPIDPFVVVKEIMRRVGPADPTGGRSG